MSLENHLEKESGTVKRVNRFVLIIITIIDSFLFFGYIGDYVQKNISFGFMLTVVAAVVISMAACYTVYFRKKESDLFKYISILLNALPYFF